MQDAATRPTARVLGLREDLVWLPPFAPDRWGQPGQALAGADITRGPE